MNRNKIATGLAVCLAFLALSLTLFNNRHISKLRKQTAIDAAITQFSIDGGYNKQNPIDSIRITEDTIFFYKAHLFIGSAVIVTK